MRGSLRPPVAKQFRVIAVFEAGFDQYDSKLVYTDLYEAQAFYEQGDTVTGVEMKVDDIDRRRRGRGADRADARQQLYHTMDWEELNHGLFTALRIQQIVMSLVLALIIVVAAFTVIATLIMVVLDKKKEIAVLKAMGATDWRPPAHLSSTRAGSSASSARALGLGFGYAVCKWILVYGFPLDPKVYFISRLPVQIRPSNLRSPAPSPSLLACSRRSGLRCTPRDCDPRRHFATRDYLRRRARSALAAIRLRKPRSRIARGAKSPN